jgi:hypothetical protein
MTWKVKIEKNDQDKRLIIVAFGWLAMIFGAFSLP